MGQDKKPGGDSSSGSPVIRCGSGRDIIAVQREGDVLLITAEEEAPGAALVDATKQAVDMGILTPRVSVLVDLTRFFGTIDWDAIHAVRQMDIWGPGEGASLRAAFLVRESAFSSLVTLTSTLFPRANLRLFTERRDALDWLAQDPDTA